MLYPHEIQQYTKTQQATPAAARIATSCFAGTQTGHAPVATAVAQHLRKRALETKVDPVAILSCAQQLTAEEQSLFLRNQRNTAIVVAGGEQLSPPRDIFQVAVNYLFGTGEWSLPTGLQGSRSTVHTNGVIPLSHGVSQHHTPHLQKVN